MGGNHVNRVIDRIVRDEGLAHDVLARGQAALQEYDLTPDEANAVAAALQGDVGQEPFAALRALVRFEPLFAAYSATATKKG